MTKKICEVCEKEPVDFLPHARRYVTQWHPRDHQFRYVCRYCHTDLKVMADKMMTPLDREGIRPPSLPWKPRR